MNRILFYIFPGFEAFADTLAQAFSSRLNEPRFAALITRESFSAQRINYLTHSASTPFRPILSESEMLRSTIDRGFRYDQREIERLDREYGSPTLWQFVTADRLLSMTKRGFLYDYGTQYTPEMLLAIVSERFHVIEQLFDEFKPDLVLFCGYDTSPGTALVLDRIASRRSIPLRVPHRARLGTLTLVNDTIFNRFRHVEASYHQIRQGTRTSNRAKAEDLLSYIQSGRGRYHKALEPDERPRIGVLKEQLRSIGKQGRAMIKELTTHDPSSDPFQIPLRNRLFSSVKRYHRLWVNRTRNQFEEAMPGERFILFPLHYEPELSLQVYAPFKTHQIAIIQNIAQSLPADKRLYVKEHPVSFAKGRRSPAYYDRLRRIPNVRVVSGDSHELIKKSDGVVTITGTAGLEAMLLRKPVLTLGRVYYNFMTDFIMHTTDLEAVPTMIRRFDDMEHEDAKLVDFLSSILEHSIEVDLDSNFWRLESRCLPEDEFHEYFEFLLTQLGRDSETPPRNGVGLLPTGA